MHSIARTATRISARPSRLVPTTAFRYASSSTMHDNDPEVLEREKRKNLSGTQHETSTPHKSHAPGWNEHLASESEAHIKADQAPGSVEELVKTTVEYVKRRHPREGTDESFSLREEIDGPLKSALGSVEADTAENSKDKSRPA